MKFIFTKVKASHHSPKKRAILIFEFLKLLPKMHFLIRCVELELCKYGFIAVLIISVKNPAYTEQESNF
jgi:hypothetical protein